MTTMTTTPLGPRSDLAAPAPVPAGSLPLAERSIRIVIEPPGPAPANGSRTIGSSCHRRSSSAIRCTSRGPPGCMVEDVDGNVFLDAQAGVATASTGHCHPAVAAAIAAQAENLIHICGTDFHYPALRRRVRTAGRPGGAPDARAEQQAWQTFLTNSGTEAVEAALKLARHHTGRGGIIAFRGGFHGRTYGSLSLTASKTKYRKHFGPLLPSVFHAEWGSAASVREELFAHLVAPEDVAAIVVEPVLGEGGYLLPPPDFLPALRRNLRRPRHPAGVRRGAVGHGPHRQDVRCRALRRHARRRAAGQGDRVGHAARRDDGAHASS